MPEIDPADLFYRRFRFMQRPHVKYRFRRRFFTHPFTLLFCLLWLVRFFIGLMFHILEQKSAIAPPHLDFVWNQLWSLGEIFALMLVFTILMKAVSLRKIVIFPMVVLFNIFIIWSIADPFVFTLAGDHLTPSLLRHFAGWDIFTSDYLWEPIKQNGALLLSALIIIIAETILVWKIIRKSITAFHRFDASAGNIAMTAILAVLLLFLPSFLGKKNSYTPEVEFLMDAAGAAPRVPGNDEIKSLRNFIAKNKKGFWVSDEYPLIFQPDKTPEKARTPDIVLVIIESLRAEDLTIFNAPKAEIDLKGLNRLSRKGVTFPHFISNGFPSTEGFHSINTGTWPHARRRVVLDFKQTQFDYLPARLSKAGYLTLRIEDDPDFDEEGYWVRKNFQHVITFRDKGLWASEKEMVDSAIRFIRKADRQKIYKPVFVQIKTKTPHYPYRYPDDENKRYIHLGKPSKNYPEALKYVDCHLQRLWDFLEARPESRPVVVFVTGDHANVLDKSTATGLPVNDLVWCGLVVSGPEDLIGKTRKDDRHCSQVDIMPTILNLIGDQGPRIPFGTDLLTASPSRGTAVAVRPAGVRLDREGTGRIVDTRYPNHFFCFPFPWDSPTMKQTDIQSSELLQLTRTWSQLIEANKVWNEELVSGP